MVIVPILGFVVVHNNGQYLISSFTVFRPKEVCGRTVYLDFNTLMYIVGLQRSLTHSSEFVITCSEKPYLVRNLFLCSSGIGENPIEQLISPALLLYVLCFYSTITCQVFHPRQQVMVHFRVSIRIVSHHLFPQALDPVLALCAKNSLLSSETLPL